MIKSSSHSPLDGLTIIEIPKQNMKKNILENSTPVRPLKWMITLLGVTLILLYSPFVSAKLMIDVDNPNLMKMPIAIADFVSESSGAINGKDLAAIVKNDLYMTGIFQIVECSLSSAMTPGLEPNFDYLTQLGVQAFISGNYQVQGDQLTIEARLYDVGLRKLEMGKRFTAKLNDHRRMIHLFNDRVLEKLTGIPGSFSGKIAFAGDSQSREIYSMDYDGHNLQQLTRNGTINVSPDWAPDGNSLIFTSYMNRNPGLWWLELPSTQYRPVSTRPGLNASGRFSPDGNFIALSISIKSIPKIFIINTRGDILKQLTNGRGNDISPTWSPDASTIAYVSDQAGAPQIYLIPVNGGESRRLTFVSNYNTDPDWSPRGEQIAFTARIDGRFQICAIKVDGSDFRVLTTQGSNQEPAWSPDGRLITFTSNRDGGKRIYVMDAKGAIQVPVSPVLGKNPAWSRNNAR